jgi:predicted nucleic acid-binding protein
LDRFAGRTITTAAVVTEVMYFVSNTRGGPRSLADWIVRTGTIIVDVCRPADLTAAARLMERYRDTPMDFADATLVLTAELLEITDIFTLDRRGFSTFRTSAGAPFNLVLDAA